MIVSDAFCHSKYAQKSQEWFLKNSCVLRLDFFSKIKIFDAGVHNITYLFQRAEGRENKPERRVHDPEFGAVNILTTSEQKNLSYRMFFPEDASIQRLSSTTLSLEEICYISVGMVVNAHEKLAPGTFKLKDLISDKKDKVHPKPFVEGKNLRKWIMATHKHLEWDTERSPNLFRRKTFVELYEHDEKLMLPMVGEIRAAIDTQRFYCNHGIFVAVPWHRLTGIRNNSLKKAAHYRDEKTSKRLFPERENLEKISLRFSTKYLLGVINSTPARNFLSANRRNNVQLYPDDWKQLPIPDAASQQQAPVVKFVDKILNALRSDLSANITPIESELDALVAHLYKLTEEEYSLILSETDPPDPFRVAALNAYRDLA